MQDNPTSISGNSNSTPEQLTIALTPGTDFLFNYRNDQNNWARHGNDTILSFDPAAPIPVAPLLTDLEGSASRFNFDILLGDFLDEDLSPELFRFADLTGINGLDRFILGDWRTPYYLDDFLLGLQQIAIVADFQPELDTIQLHGFREDYIDIPFFLFGENPQTGETDIIDGRALVFTGANPTTQQSDFDILAFFPDVPPMEGLPPGGLPLPEIDLDSDAFEFVGTTPTPAVAKSNITQIGTNGVDSALGVSTDADGNVYVVGTTTGTLGESSQGAYDAWLAKYDSLGNQVWINQLGTQFGDVAWDIEAFVTEDDDVNLYVTGATTGDLALELGGSEPNEGYQDIWVARFDGDGNVIEARQNPQPILGPEIDNSLQIDVDSEGNLFQSGVILEQSDSDLVDVQDFAFVASYNPDLELRFFDGETLESTDRAGFDESYGIAVSADGTTYVTGFTQNNLGGDPIGVYDPFLARFDENGDPIFVTTFGTVNYDFGWGVDTDSQNNVYVAGWTRGDLSDPFDQTLTSPIPENDAFLAKYDGQGNQLWVQQIGTGGDDGLFLGDVVVDADDNIYITGFTDSDLGGPNQGEYDAWVGRFDTEGNQKWITQFGSSDLDMPTAITADNQGSLFVTGFTEGSLGGVFQGATDGWIAKLNAETGEIKPFNNTASIDIEKRINGKDADTQADALAIGAHEAITWTYEVTNTGNIAFNFDDISVTDDQEGITLTFVAESDALSDGILSAGETWLYRAVGEAEDLTTVIDFETDGNGNILQSGDVIDTEYQALGLTVSTPVNEFGAMIFDSDNPTGGDSDLRNPARILDESGENYVENQDSLGNILIISEDGDSLDADDNAAGGIVKFEWNELVLVNSVSLLDIDTNEQGSEIRTFNTKDELIGSSAIQSLGDNSFQTVDVNDEMVQSLEVELMSSGAITEVSFERFHRNTATVTVDGYLGVGDSDSAYYRNSQPLSGSTGHPDGFELNNGLVQAVLDTLRDLPVSSA